MTKKQMWKEFFTTLLWEGRIDCEVFKTKETVIKNLLNGKRVSYYGNLKEGMFEKYWINASDGKFYGWKSDTRYFDHPGYVTEITIPVEQYFNELKLTNKQYRNFY